MLNQQLKQIQDKLKRLKSQKVISKDDEIEIKRIEKWFDELQTEKVVKNVESTSKEEVLTLYLNTIYFGTGADGIGAAAYVYYGKTANELSLAEAAMMVSLLPCPSTCNPLSNPSRAVERRRTRLKNMLKQSTIFPFFH